MAIGTPIERSAATYAAQTNTTVISGVTLTAGTVAIVAARGGGNGVGGKVISSITDTLGNTWAVDATCNDSGNRGLSLASAQITSGGTSTLTITWGVISSATCSVWIQEVSGLASSLAFDKTAHNVGTSTSPSSGATATLSQAAEIAFGLICTNTSTTWTKGASWSNPTTPTLDPTFNMLEYQIVAATTALTATGTFGTSGTWNALIGTYKGAAASPPANTVAPAVTGTAKVGSVLTTTNGTWTDNGSPTFTYQWQRGGVNIGAATSSTYTLVDADDATNVRCVVTDTDANGATAANSNAVAITEPVPTNSVAPAVTGTATVGSVLTSTTGTWTHQGGTVATYAYQWQRGGVNIAAATSSTYTLVDADDATNVRCVVTATNSGGAGTPANSNAVAVTEPVPTNSVAPAVTGTTGLGDTLTSTSGTWTHQGGTVATYTYQWQRDSVDIAAATAATRVIASADQGHDLRCVVTATNTGGAGTPANSNAVSVPAAGSASTATTRQDVAAILAAHIL